MNLLKRIFRSKSTGQPREVARVLFDGWVERDHAPIPKEDLSETQWPLFQSKWRLYREATVLMVLLSRKAKDPSYYSDLLKEYERLIFPGEEPNAEGLAKLSTLKTAMRDIGDLIDNAKGREITWSKNWFEQFAELPRNPVTCMSFSLFFMDFWVEVAKSLEDLASDGIVP